MDEKNNDEIVLTLRAWAEADVKSGNEEEK